MTLILPEYNKLSRFNSEKMTNIQEIVNYLRQLDKDMQRLSIALRPDQVTDLVDEATVATDVSIAIHFRLTLTDAVGSTRVLGNPTNPRDGQRVIWEFIQGGTGNKAITLDTAFALGADISAINLSTTVGAIDFMGCVYDSINSVWRVVAFVSGY